MKHVLTLWALLGAPATTLAQATARSHWASTSTAPHVLHVGVKGGFSQGDLQGAGSPAFSSQFGVLSAFHAGAYARYGFTHFAAMQSELLYSRKGFQGSGLNQPAGTAEPASRLNYFALPVLLVGQFSERISVHLGPQVAVLLDSRSGDQPLDLSRSAYQRLDISGVAGVEIRCGPTRLGGRCDYSLRPLNAAGIATTTSGQLLQVLPLANDYHSLVLQAYLCVELHTSRPGVSL